MGYLLSGLFGSVKNKIGGVIFSNWKGINTAREYKIPANPNTAAQQAQRTKFAALVALAQSLLPTLITTFWNPFAVKMSGFNYFIKTVFPDATSAGLITVDCLVSKGTLEMAPLISAEYTSGTGAFDIAWDDTIDGNGLATDEISWLVLDKSNNDLIEFSLNESVRSSGSTSITVASGLTVTNLLVFGFLSRGSGSDFIVSDSSGIQATAA